MAQSGGDLSEGFEDEATLVQGGVREGEVRAGEDEASAGFGGDLAFGVEEKVEIDKTRALGRVIAVADASHAGFKGEERAQEFDWAEGGFEQGGGVGEARLVEETHGVSFVEAGDCGDVAQAGEAVESLVEVAGGGRVVGGSGGREVGAEGNGG